MLPFVTILVCTYDRPRELVKTITALAEYLIYPRERLHCIVADDHTPDYWQKIEDAWEPKPAGIADFLDLAPDIISTPTNSGWGANVNHGLGAVTDPYIFFLEDDRVLTAPLDLEAGVNLMLATPTLGMLRYGGTAGDHYVYHQLEADISEAMPDHRDGMGLPGKISYLQMDGGSPSLYIYSNQPHLKRQSFHRFYGLYPTGLKLGETEEAYAHLVKDKMGYPGAPGIAVLPDWVTTRFDHIGQSYQHGPADH